MIGTISNIVVAKKYGFISGDNGQEYFFHLSDVDSGWDELLYEWSVTESKIQVDFEPTKTQKGPRARNVKVTNAQKGNSI